MIQCSCGSTNGCNTRLYIQDDGITMVWDSKDPRPPDLGEHKMYADDEALKQLVRDAVAVLRQRAMAKLTAELNIGELP